jgi:hypothetical protein
VTGETTYELPGSALVELVQLARAAPDWEYGDVIVSRFLELREMEEDL